MTFEAIMKDLKNGIYKPVYFLHGDESYFIDKITDYILNNVLQEHEKAFNQTVLYGLKTKAIDLINSCKRFPMMANYQVIVLKEAQNCSDITKLQPYIENPQKSTILVINYKHKTYDTRRKLYKLIDKNGVTLTSKKIWPNQLQKWINFIVAENNVKIEPKATVLLAEYLGEDLSKIDNEVKKLKTAIEGKHDTITVDDVEKNIGISKEYSVFELYKALAIRDVLKANKIINFMGKNPKDFNHPIPVISNLFRFYKNVFTYHLLKDKSKNNAAAALGVSPFMLQDYVTASRNFTAKKIVQIFSVLREYDLKAKGLGANNLPALDLYKEMLFKILH